MVAGRRDGAEGQWSAARPSRATKPIIGLTERDTDGDQRRVVELVGLLRLVVGHNRPERLDDEDL